MAKRRAKPVAAPQQFPKSSFAFGQSAASEAPPEPDEKPDDFDEADALAEPARQASPEAAAEQRLGSLADHLERTGRHPVVIFGIGSAGKTTLLMSLVQAINRSNEVNIFLGEPILPEEDPRAEQSHEQAITFFEHDAQAFALGEPVPPTRLDDPYFIPVDIVHKRNGRVVRLALLEGKGEWYAPITGAKKGSMFQKFKRDLADLLELYGESITVLWVAPYAIGAGKKRDTRNSDLGLTGAINNYRKHRTAIGQDHHLFLLNKWDCYAPPLQDNPQFSVVTDTLVDALIGELYPNAWPNYEALSLQTVGRRFFMQYASGHIVGDQVRVPPQRHRSAFDRYPRTVWNWLYGNATQSEVGAAGARTRETLFPDILPRPKRAETLLEKLIRLILPR